jgi:hypothetical protein
VWALDVTDPRGPLWTCRGAEVPAVTCCGAGPAHPERPAHAPARLRHCTAGWIWFQPSRGLTCAVRGRCGTGRDGGGGCGGGGGGCARE